MKRFTLYGLRKPGEQFRYVGITCQPLNDRLSRHLRPGNERSHKTSWIAKALRENVTVEMVPFLVEMSKECAQDVEIFLIKELRASGWPLVNSSLGGSLGSLGLSPSTETRAKLSAAQMGKKSNFLGKKHSAETRARMSAAKKGNWSGEKSPSFGKKRSAETIAKMSAARKGKCVGKENPFFGKTHSAETCARMSASHTGVKLSLESRKNMSLAQRKRRSNERM